MRKLYGRERRRKKIRKRVIGTCDRPRMVVSRSLKNTYIQLVDDIEQKTLMSMSTSAPEIKKAIAYGGNLKAAEKLGVMFAKNAKEKGITRVVFDRSGYMYHGRVKAIAESAKKGGLSFGREKETTGK
jgi:large subunit ribosomal protein L18